VLGVACRERPTRVVGRKLGVTNGGHALTPHCVALFLNGEQGDGGVAEDQQVALTELHEGLVDSPLQSVVEVVAPSCGEPSRHGRVSGVSWDVYMDHAEVATRTYSRLAEVATRHCQVSTRPGYAVVTRRTTDCNLYRTIVTVLKQPHLEGRVHDSHHPVGGDLPSYLDVGASLQKVNCRK
jgi:hypothetical protein